LKKNFKIYMVMVGDLYDIPPHPSLTREEIDFIIQRWGQKQLRWLIFRDGLNCCWCKKKCELKGRSSGIAPSREHVIRKAEGGSFQMDNLKVACRQCNSERHDTKRNPEEKKANHIRRLKRFLLGADLCKDLFVENVS